MGITNKQRGGQVFMGDVAFKVVRYAEDGPIQSTQGHTALLTKTSAGAYTLAAPARDGVRLGIISRSAFAHVIVATGLLDEGTAGGAKNRITFTAATGASAHLVSVDGFWNAISVLGANIGN